MILLDLVRDLVVAVCLAAIFSFAAVLWTAVTTYHNVTRRNRDGR